MAEQEEYNRPKSPTAYPSVASYVSPSAEQRSVDGEWERQFVDDLIAANRLKSYLVAQGVEVSIDVLKGLAKLSTRFEPEIDTFVASERDRAVPWFLRWPAERAP